MADRIGIISKGNIILVEETQRLMRQLGKKTLTVHFKEPQEQLPQSLLALPTELIDGGTALRYVFQSSDGSSPALMILRELDRANIVVADVESQQSSLEEIFVDLVHKDAPIRAGVA